MITTVQLQHSERENPAADLKIALEESGLMHELFEALLGVSLKQGENQMDCPSGHESEGHTCFNLNTEKGVWNCHHCDLQGDVFSFLIEFYGMDFKKAFDYLKSQLSGIDKEELKELVKARKERGSESPKVCTAKEADVANWENLLYKPQMRSSVLEFLYRRGITDEGIKHFRIGAGYITVPPTWNPVPAVTIPLYNGSKELAAVKAYHYEIGKEKVPNTDGSSKQILNYLKLLEPPTTDWVFLCAGEMDAIRLWQELPENVVLGTACGENTWDSDWNPLFKDKWVAVVYDSDATGRKGAAKVVEQLKPHVRGISNVNLFPEPDKDHKDVTDFFKHGGTIEEFLDILMATPIEEKTEPLCGSADQLQTVSPTIVEEDLMPEDKTPEGQSTTSEEIEQLFKIARNNKDDTKAHSDSIHVLLNSWSGLKDDITKSIWKNKIKSTFKLPSGPFDLAAAERMRKKTTNVGLLLPVPAPATPFDIYASHKIVMDEDCANAICDWFESNGATWFKDNNGNRFLSFENKVYTLSTVNEDFMTFLHALCNATKESRRGRTVVEVMKYHANLNGKTLDTDAGWVRFVNNRLYLNLNNPRNELVKIDSEKVEVVANLHNEDDTFLKDSDWMKEVEVKALSHDELKKGAECLKRYVVDSIACPKNEKWLLFSWAACTVFGDIASIRPAMRIEGSSSSGKTAATDVLGYLLNGRESMMTPTVAALYAMGSRIQLVFLDNLEQDKMREVKDWLTTCVTGNTKAKRAANTETGVTQELQRCFVVSNGIENLYKNEVLNRHFIVNADMVKYGMEEFSKTDVIQAIKDNRSLMLNALYAIYSKMIARIVAGDLKTLKAAIRLVGIRNRSKERLDDYLVIMALFSEEFLKVMNIKLATAKIMVDWIASQEKQACDYSMESDPLVQYFERLRAEIVRIQSIFTTTNLPQSQDSWRLPMNPPKYDPATGEINWEGKVKTLHNVFKQLLSGQTPPYTFKDALQLSRRLRDSKSVLEQSGWFIQPIEGKENAHGGATWSFCFKSAG